MVMLYCLVGGAIVGVDERLASLREWLPDRG